MFPQNVQLAETATSSKSIGRTITTIIRPDAVNDYLRVLC